MSRDLIEFDNKTVAEARAALNKGTRDPDVLRALLSDLIEAQARADQRAEKHAKASEEARSDAERNRAERDQSERQLDYYSGELENDVTARTQELKTERAKLEKLVDLGIAMAAERDENTLLWLILEAAMELTHADGGTFYLMAEDNRSLTFKILKNKTLGVELGTDPSKPVSLPPVPLFDRDTGQENHHNVVTSAVWRRETVNIPDAYSSKDYDFSGTKSFDESNGYRSISFLTVPLTPRGGEVTGALQLINATDPETGSIVPFDEDLQGFIEALAAQAAVTMDNQKLLVAQRTLMDSFIELIAGAIDAKSPYTGEHCKRVPELAMMLVQKAHASDTGPFANFAFANEDEWREFRIAAWLHDCGKVTTPEYVVDKATKLETIYNRIHEVRTRFEVLYRDHHINLLRQRIAVLGGEPDAGIEADLEGILEKLRADYAFVAECNIGGEHMSEDAQIRLADLATTQWTRYFDDRIGLSQDEEMYLEDHAPVPVPAPERLLIDRPSQVRPRKTGHAEQIQEAGFKMDIPHHLNNLGELYNLSISKGTLNTEERFTINEHIIQTIVMLETLPFPPHLRRVPEIAGGHHETMVGTGYPRKLTRDQMSIPARVMAIADIFEALTASDRPYKKGKTLSESLRIMCFMCKNRHIDPDIFVLFLETKTYMEYADAFLSEDQIDDVPLDDLLSDARRCCAPGYLNSR